MASERWNDLRGQQTRTVHRDDVVVITGAEYLRMRHHEIFGPVPLAEQEDAVERAAEIIRRGVLAGVAGSPIGTWFELARAALRAAQGMEEDGR